MKSIKEYQKTLENEEETHSHIKNTENTLIRNFSLAKFILHEIITSFQNILRFVAKKPEEESKSSLFDRQQSLMKFHMKCETLKENISEILAFLEKEQEIVQIFEKSPVSRKNAFTKPMLRPFLKSPDSFSIDFQSKIEEAFKIHRKNTDELVFTEETPFETSMKGHKLDNIFKKTPISFFQDPLPEENNPKKSDFLLQSSMETSQFITTPVTNTNKLQSLKENYDRYLTNLITIVHRLNMRELYVALMLIHAKMCIELKETYKSIVILKQAKSIASELNFANYRLKCYEKLGKAFQILKNFKLALKFFVKMLEMAFVCEANHKELQAYDLIGIQFYYQGRTEIAEFFHKKLLEGETEPEDSNLRKIAKRKYSLRNKTLNYSLPGYIAARPGLMNYDNLENDSSEDEENDLKIQELMGKYKENDRFWQKLKKKTAKLNGGPIDLQGVLENANKNIRQAKHDRRSFYTNDYHWKKKGGEGLEKTDLLRINHLSPNRYFAKPNIYEFKMNKLSKEDNLKLNKKVMLVGQRMFGKMLRRFQGFIEKLRNNLRVTLMQIEFYLMKIRDSGISRRKKGFICSPLLRKSIKMIGEKKTRIGSTAVMGKGNKRSVEKI